MNAPKEKVLKKFLAAHRKRSQLMTSQFLSSLVVVGDKDKSNGDNGAVVTEHHLTSAAARQYHQSMLVGLIEACKGITELFQENSASSSSSASSSTASLSSLLLTAETDFTSTMKETIEEYTKSISKGFSSFFTLYHQVFQTIPLDLSSLNDKDMKYLDDIFHFNLKISSQSASSSSASSSSSSSSSAASSEDDDASSDGGAGASHDGEGEAKEAEASSSSSSSEKFVLQDERGAWLLLARQAILDVKYLDSTFSETVQKLSSLSSASSVSSAAHKKTPETVLAGSSSFSSSFSVSFAKSLLSQIQNHITFMRKYTISCFVDDLLHWFPKVISIIEFGSSFASSASSLSSSGLTGSSSSSLLSSSDGSNRDRDRDRDRDGGNDNSSGSSAPHTTSSLISHSGASSASSLLAKKTQGISILFNLLTTHASETFSDCARFVKPLIDIYEVATLDPVMLCKNLIVEFSSYFTAEIEKRVGILRNLSATSAAAAKKKHIHATHSYRSSGSQGHGHGGHGQHSQPEDNEEEIDIEEIPEIEFNKHIGKLICFLF
jgi:hypothetical protein